MPDPCFPLLAPAPRRWPPVPALALLVGEPEAVYRPRHPERTAVYRLFDRHFDDYVRTHEERFERPSGPLRPVVPRTVEAYLDCGRLFGGFARLRCPKCRVFSFWGEHLLAFSCHPPPPRLRRGRNAQFLPQLPGQTRGTVRREAGG